MMDNKFVFQDNGTVLDFGTAKFVVDVTDPDLIDKVLTFAKGAQDKAKELKDNEDYVEGLREIIKFSLGSIDSMLGEGASEEIFKGRKVSMMDAIQVLDYITEEVKKGKETAFKPYSPNRAERRAK